jgi:hypothetical protein
MIQTRQIRRLLGKSGRRLRPGDGRYHVDADERAAARCGLFRLFVKDEDFFFEFRGSRGGAGDAREDLIDEDRAALGVAGLIIDGLDEAERELEARDRLPRESCLRLRFGDHRQGFGGFRFAGAGGLGGLHRLPEGDAGFLGEPLLRLRGGDVRKSLGAPPRDRDRQRQFECLLSPPEICLSANDFRERPAAARLVLDRLRDAERLIENAVARRRGHA